MTKETFGDRLFGLLWILPPAMLAFAFYEYFTNDSHAKSWIGTTGIVEDLRPICRFEKRLWFQKNALFSEEFCDDKLSIKARIQDDWQSVSRKKIMINLDIVNGQGNHEQRKFEPWESDVPFPLTIGSSLNVQYSEESSDAIELAGRPAQVAGDALKAVIVATIVCIALFVWWRIRKLRGQWL